METFFLIVLITCLCYIMGFFFVKLRNNLQRMAIRLRIEEEKRQRTAIREEIKRNIQKLLEIDPQKISDNLKIEIWDMLWEGICPACNGKIEGGFEGGVPSTSTCVNCRMSYWVTSVRKLGAFPLKKGE